MSNQDPLSGLLRSFCENDSPGLSMDFKVEDFARQVYGDKLQVSGFQNICILVENDEEIPGFAAKDFDVRQFTKKGSVCIVGICVWTVVQAMSSLFHGN